MYKYNIYSVAAIYFRSFNTQNITDIDCMIGGFDLLKRGYLNIPKGITFLMKIKIMSKNLMQMFQTVY